MIPLRVYVKGFLSYRGEEMLDFRERKLWMLSGKNGAGKSAVFDAITFALFRKHRGSGSNSSFTDLINWHRDEFEVMFDFQVGEDTYRAERKVRRNGAAERLLSRWDGASWMPLERANIEDDFQKHIRRILGMDYETFSVAVLLRQGKIDHLLEIDPADRFTVLSQIVDLSRYRDLHQRAGRRRDYLKGQADGAADDLNKVPEVIGEQIADQETRAEQAKAEANSAQQRVTQLAGLVVKAEQWEGLETKRAAAKKAVENAAALIADEATIRRDADRLADLNAVLPALAELHQARGEHVEAEADLQKAQSILTEQCAAVAPAIKWDTEAAQADPNGLLRAVQSDVDAIADLKTALPSLKRFAQQRSAARTALAEQEQLLASPVAEPAPFEIVCADQISAQNKAEKELSDANTAAALAKQAAKDAKERLERFQQAGHAAECHYCGQFLSSELRECMKVDLTRERDDREAGHRQAADAATQAQKTRDAANTALTQAKEAWQQGCADAGDYQRNLETQSENYAAAHREAVAACGELPKTLAEQITSRPVANAPHETGWADQSAASDFFPTEANLLGLGQRTDDLQTRRDQHKQLQDAINEAAEKRVLPEERCRIVERLLEKVPVAWAEFATPDVLSETTLRLLTQERENLKGADERQEALDQARNNQGVLRERWKEAVKELRAVALRARRPAQKVRDDLTQVEKERDAADLASRDADTEVNRLRGLRDQRAALRKKRDDARRDEGLYKTLAELLGPDKLQSYLLAGAEGAITDYANEALGAFSGGTLRLARRAESDVDQASATGVTGDKKRKALDLLCSNTETADAPLPLHNLSGSQKFRVAVALALGIGQFASASDARIQSVIIDEGFGSLDPQNQSDMARELRGLTDRLERIIVVSHQETFADGFDDRIHVTLGENGSHAEPMLA